MSLFDYIHKGGNIAYLLLLFNIVGFTIMVWKIIVFTKFSRQRESFFSEFIHHIKEIGAKLGSHNSSNILKNHIRSKVKDLETGLNTIKIIATISPLLGLLGTVIGILKSFEKVSVLGMENPAVFADSISLALITTVMGLMVAVPHYIGYNYFIGYMYSQEDLLEKEMTLKLAKEEQ